MSSDGKRETGEIREREQALYHAMTSEDFTALKEIFADDLVFIHSTGVAESKDEYLAGAASGRYDYERIGSRDVVTWTSGDVAVQTGIVEMSVGGRGKPKDLVDLLFTLVWKRDASRWRLALRQATRIPPEQPAEDGRPA